MTGLAAAHPNLQYLVCYERPTAADREAKRFDKEGYLDAAWLGSILPTREADFYFCGPMPFMKAVYRVLKGWNLPPERVHYEFFGPSAELEAYDPTLLMDPKELDPS